MKGQYFTPRGIETGAPQGLVFGPTLYALCINDIEIYSVADVAYLLVTPRCESGSGSATEAANSN
jgi:hypothetical protein